MDTSDLIGAELDAAVARACSELIAKIDDRGVWVRRPRYDCAFNIDLYSPSTDWSQGGPIIEKERIALLIWPAKGFTWAGQVWGHADPHHGETPLIAAMRAFVASKK